MNYFERIERIRQEINADIISKALLYRFVEKNYRNPSSNSSDELIYFRKKSPKEFISQEEMKL